ncbi:MAG: helix-turn-helix domain-containing protein [Methylobacter sp.]
MDVSEDNLVPFPQRLKEARIRTGVSQKKLGILAGIDEFSSSARINQYEKGKHAPDFPMAKRLAAVLNIPTSYLYEADDDIASMLMLYYQLNDEERKKVLEEIRAVQTTKLKNS